MSKSRAKPADHDPYAAMSSGGEEAATLLVDPPKLSDGSEGVVTTVESPPETTQPLTNQDDDATTSALTTGASIPERKYKSDADPLTIYCLELFERIHAGGLLYSSAYTVYDMTLDAIGKLRERVVDVS